MTARCRAGGAVADGRAASPRLRRRRAAASCAVPGVLRAGMAGAFLMEIRRGTQSALLVIRYAPVEVSVCADSLEVRSGGSCDAAALPAGVRLAPSSCRGLRRLRGDGLHLRVRLRGAPPAAGEGGGGGAGKNYIFYCQSCGDIVVKDRKFVRVLPLPSENWSDLVEEWCCHPDPFARSTLHPQHGDCFIGDTFFLLNSGNESHSKENTRVICKRCKAILGETVSSDTIKYYVTEVIIQPTDGSFSPTPRSQFVQSIVAQCLLELSSARSTFRFIIKGDNGKTYILIWLLNSDTLLVESLGSSSSQSDFTLFGDILTPSSGPVGTWNAVKVLYQPCIQCRNKELADAWENDMGVHPLKFPSETCLELLLILGLSTTSLPPSLRCMNSFQVSNSFCYSMTIFLVVKTYRRMLL
uniref:E3 ubiquitin-protein ligase E3D n=1 Tax=Catharus ustulatus TaxID=91951 RepID=A0A8C3XYY7_CATUS